MCQERTKRRTGCIVIFSFLFFFLTNRMPSSDLIDVVIEHLVGRRSFAGIRVIFQIITLLLNVRG